MSDSPGDVILSQLNALVTGSEQEAVTESTIKIDMPDLISKLDAFRSQLIHDRRQVSHFQGDMLDWSGDAVHIFKIGRLDQLDDAVPQHDFGRFDLSCQMVNDTVPLNLEAKNFGVKPDRLRHVFRIDANVHQTFNRHTVDPLLDVIHVM